MFLQKVCLVVAYTDDIIVCVVVRYLHRHFKPKTRVGKTGAGIFKQSMGARNRGGIGLSYWPARLHRLAEFIPCYQFRGSIKV
jgi:hypothetical protein